MGASEPSLLIVSTDSKRVFRLLIMYCIAIILLWACLAYLAVESTDSLKYNNAHLVINRVYRLYEIDIVGTSGPLVLESTDSMIIEF